MISVELSIVVMISVELSIVAKTNNLQNFAFRICANFRRKIRPFFSSFLLITVILVSWACAGGGDAGSRLLFLYSKKIPRNNLIKKMK